jgi:hypothetical protein
MERLLRTGILMFCTVFLWAALAYAQEQDSNAIVNQLNTELEKEATFTPQDLKPIGKPLKNMLDKGAAKEDLKKVLKDLSEKGIKGKDLKSTVDSMNDLVNSGESPKEAGNIVSRAAHQAQAQGLKGTALAAKVREAIKQRKAERDKLKEEKKRQREESKKEKELPKGKIQEHKQGKGMGHGYGHTAEGKGRK